MGASALVPCPRCGQPPTFVARDLPTGTHASYRFICPSIACGYRGPGISQRLEGPRARGWGQINAALAWNRVALLRDPHTGGN